MGMILRLVMLFSLFPLPGASRAADGLTCLNTSCQAQAQTCLAAAYSEEAACVKAVIEKCDKLPMSQRYLCRGKEQHPCRGTMHAQENACVASVKSCAKPCDLKAGDGPYFWCNADRKAGPVSGFCIGEPGKQGSEAWKGCARKLFSVGPVESFSIGCEAL